MIIPAGRLARREVAGRLVAVIFFAAASLLLRAFGAGELGQELKRVQEDLLQKTGETTKQPAVKVHVAVTNQPEKNAAASSSGPRFEIKTLEIRGDQDVLERAGIFDALKSEVEGQKLGAADIRNIAERYGMMLITNQVGGGYLAASVSVPPGQDYSSGKVLFNVTGGRVGHMNLFEKPSGTNAATEPFRGRYFSQQEIEHKLAAITNEPYFNYNVFYRAILTLNSHPDLNIDTDLKLRTQRVPGAPEQRFIDMDYKVDERFPLHAVLSIGNNGTDITSEWRAGLTVQHLNLTKHDDVMTVSIPVSFPDVSIIQSVAASYYLPHSYLRGGAFTLYGGYSRLKADNLFNSTDPASRLSSSGRGYFVGAQAPFTIVENQDRVLSISPGIAYRIVEDTLTLGNNDATIDRNLTLTPVSVAISYNTGAAGDSIGGRNFLSLDTSYNPGSALGGSGSDVIVAQRAAAKAEYFIERLHFARLQPFAGRRDAKGNPYAQWLIFSKAEGQYASAPLIPADQFGLGGLDSVRGFPDRVALGDDGISGTVELRTPIISGLIFKNTQQDERAKKAMFARADRLQFVTFIDAGYLQIKDALQGEPANQDMVGAGVGFRLQFTENILARADWGVPLSYSSSLKETSGNSISSSGRAAVSVQVQF